MKINRFFVSEKLNGQSSIVIRTTAFIHQIKNVFRMNKGDEVILFDNSGFDFIAIIEEFMCDEKGNDAVKLTITKTLENNVLPLRETYLFASIIKKDNFEWITEKATELGVSHIIPIISERTEKKDINLERIQKIIIEAAEQSGRGTLPILYDVMDLKTALTNYSHVNSVAWHTYAEKFVSQDVNQSIGAYIGPEGGWSLSELDLFKKHGIHARSLGPQILRSETAVIAVLSRLVF